MEKFNLNYLSKEELKYEITARGHETTHTNVEDLRKQLRKIANVPIKVSNLNGKFTLDEEIIELETKLDLLGILVNESQDNPSKLQVSKIKAKLCHLKLRFKTLNACKLDPNYSKKLEDLILKQTELTTTFEDIKNKISPQELEVYEETLNKSLIEEENLMEQIGKEPEPITKPSLTSTPAKQNLVSIEANQSEVLPSTSTQNPTQPINIFNKLSNPVEKYLSSITICNGLEIKPLISFLRDMITIKNETNLTDTQLFEILPSYSRAPLSTKILQCKNQGLSIDSLHQNIIATFIPIILREKLKQELVYRPQLPNEPLSLYINEIKINNQMLKTGLSEPELISFIINGLRPEVRNQILFENNPQSFEDLDRLCLNLNNVSYNDYVRNQLAVNRNPNHNFMPHYAQQNNFQPYKPRPNLQQNQPQQYRSNLQQSNPRHHFNAARNQSQEIKTCYNCNRKGHIARQCFRNQKNF